MSTTQTLLDRIEVDDATGQIGVRLLKCDLEGGEVVSTGFHRTTVDVDVAVSDQMAAVHAQLASMGYPAVSSEDLAKIEARAHYSRT